MDVEKFHDRGYKALFSHPRMVEELICSFVKEDFVRDIDFSSLTRSFNSFVTDEFKERETDIIWKVKVKGEPVYVYLLVEFQSTVDRFMVLRLLSYLLLFYLELIKDEKIKEAGRLPAVFPVLLYSGNEKWTAAQSMEELIHRSPGVPSAYIPSFRYYKIAENEFSKESLEELNNLVSHLFLIEMTDVDGLGEIAGRSVDLLKREVGKELGRTFGLWIRKLFNRRKVDIPIDIETMTGQEVKAMLEANLQKYEEELIEKSKLEGKLEGRDESALEHAKKMKAHGIEPGIIKYVTGIDIDELE
jgi:predicted transposase YdaD